MSLITETNFFVVIIALIIIFFLLGILFGKLSSRNTRERQTTMTPTTKIDEKARQTNAIGQEQDNQIESDFPELRQNKRSNRSRYGYYNNYW